MNAKKYAAEAIGTFWLVLGGCGSAVLAAAFPEVGIGLLGVSLAFGLTVLTMAYAIGHISGCHLNPAVTVGLTAGGRFPASDVVPYIVAQVVGGVIGAAVLYVIASGKPDFVIGGFASNGYGDLSPGKYGLLAALVTEVVMTAMFLFIILGCHPWPGAGGLRPDRHRPRPDPDPPDLDPGHQHLGQPGAQHRRRGVRGRRGIWASCGCSGWRRCWAAPSAAALYSWLSPNEEPPVTGNAEAPLTQSGTASTAGPHGLPPWSLFRGSS